MISVILPTYNEAANLPTVIDFLDGVLRDSPHEIIVVDDDSPDGTWQVAEGLAVTHPSVRVLRRRDKRGLSSAVIDGFDMAAGDTLVVMDADGQHDASLLPALLSAITHGADLVAGSRYMPGGSVGDWVRDRRIISRIGTFFALSVSSVTVTDPLGGFFALKKSLYRSVRPFLRPTGFKILLEILAFVHPKTVVREVPLQFRMRLHGESKLSLSVHLAFIFQVLRLAVTGLPRRIGRLASLIFWVAAIATFIFLMMRLLPLLSLRDAAVRAALRTSLQDAADRRGWLLSDITILKVTPTTASIIHQEHRRNSSEPEECTLTYSSSTLTCGVE